MNPWKYFLRNNIAPHVEDLNTAMCFFFARCVFPVPRLHCCYRFSTECTLSSRAGVLFSENHAFYTKIADFSEITYFSLKIAICAALPPTPYKHNDLRRVLMSFSQNHDILDEIHKFQYFTLNRAQTTKVTKKCSFFAKS